MSYITAIGTANPAHRFAQSLIADFMLRAMELDNGDERKLKTIFRASGIAYRHSVLEDYGKTTGFTFYPDTEDLQPFPGTQSRLKIFQENALALSVAACDDLAHSFPSFNREAVSHLIAVSCTGMYAPGLDVDLIQAMKLPSTVQRTAINFMGCQAAFNALKLADAICGSSADARVLIVCTELCSLHFQRPGTEDNLLANALFADGSAALLVEANSSSHLRLRLEAFHSELATEGLSDMAWTIGDAGFEMKLSAYVPDLIARGIRKLTDTLLEKIQASLSDIRYFAIHPGGKRILKAIEGELGISAESNAAAYHVLENFGNMSSPTVLFVLKEVMNRMNGDARGERLLSFAFGPGLTLESMVLKIENCVSHA